MVSHNKKNPLATNHSLFLSLGQPQGNRSTVPGTWSHFPGRRSLTSAKCEPGLRHNFVLAMIFLSHGGYPRLSCISNDGLFPNKPSSYWVPQWLTKAPQIPTAASAEAPRIHGHSETSSYARCAFALGGWQGRKLNEKPQTISSINGCNFDINHIEPFDSQIKSKVYPRLNSIYEVWIWGDAGSHISAAAMLYCDILLCLASIWGSTIEQKERTWLQDGDPKIVFSCLFWASEFYGFW